MADPLAESFTRVPNGLVEALATANLSGGHFRVLLTLIRESFGYQHRTAQLSAAYISRATGIGPRNLRIYLGDLRAWSIVKVLPRSRNDIPDYELELDFGRWQIQARSARVDLQITDRPIRGSDPQISDRPIRTDQPISDREITDREDQSITDRGDQLIPSYLDLSKESDQRKSERKPPVVPLGGGRSNTASQVRGNGSRRGRRQDPPAALLQVKPDRAAPAIQHQPNLQLGPSHWNCRCGYPSTSREEWAEHCKSLTDTAPAAAGAVPPDRVPAAISRYLSTQPVGAGQSTPRKETA